MPVNSQGTCRKKHSKKASTLLGIKALNSHHNRSIWSGHRDSCRDQSTDGQF